MRWSASAAKHAGTREEIQMRAVIRRGNSLVVGDMAVPVPKEGQVLVKTLCCGICGSDLHALEQPAFGGGGDGGVVFGHEFCAEVVENGPGTEGRFKPGTHVCSIPVLPIPGGMESVGYSPNVPGGFAENMLLGERLLLPVKNGLKPESAALTEPLAVGEHAVAKADPSEDHAFMVIGCGPVGLAVIDCLKARGLGPVVAVDYSPQRRALAEKLGADKIIDPAQESPHASWESMGVGGPDMSGLLGGGGSGKKSKKPVIFECVGIPGLLQSLAEAAPRGTRIVVAGVCMEMDKIHPLLFVTKEIELRFILGYSFQEFSHSLDRLCDGKTGYNDIVTQIVGLDQTPEAFTKLQTDKTQVKILVSPNA
jgi:threonine dehydrogenase-like Zn-dependent dehydrogenase